MDVPHLPQCTVGSRPDVSVLMIAYNVERYIGEAIDSVLSQRLNYSYELVVGEDRSTDRTREVLLSYAQKDGHRIRVVWREKNLGMNANFFATLAECKGRYIALLDADDYWTSPDKLQKQVDFLEAHPGFSICFHNAMVVYEGETNKPHPFHAPGAKQRLSRPLPKAVSSIEDIAGGNFMQTGSVLFRAGLIDHVPGWFYKMPTFDWPLHVCNATKGLIKYIDEIMSVYRVRPDAMWSMNFSNFRRLEDVDHMLEAYALIDQYLEGRHHEPIHRRSRWLYAAAANLLYSEGKIRHGNEYLNRYLNGLPVFRRAREFRLYVSMLLANCPALAARTQGLRSGLKRMIGRES
jgi:glycosyltransferase involved in cell wall biosynthesis